MAAITFFLKLCIFERRQKDLAKSDPMRVWKNEGTSHIAPHSSLAKAETL